MADQSKCRAFTHFVFRALAWWRQITTRNSSYGCTVFQDAVENSHYTECCDRERAKARDVLHSRDCCRLGCHKMVIMTWAARAHGSREDLWLYLSYLSSDSLDSILFIHPWSRFLPLGSRHLAKPPTSQRPVNHWLAIISSDITDLKYYRHRGHSQNHGDIENIRPPWEFRILIVEWDEGR